MYKIPERPTAHPGREIDEENISDELFCRILLCTLDLPFGDDYEYLCCDDCPLQRANGCSQWAYYLIMKKLSKLQEYGWDSWNEGFKEGYKIGLEDKENPL